MHHPANISTFNLHLKRLSSYISPEKVYFTPRKVLAAPRRLRRWGIYIRSATLRAALALGVAREGKQATRGCVGLTHPRAMRLWAGGVR